MKLEDKVIQQLQEDLKKCQTMDDLLGKDGAIKKLIKSAVEQMLQCEMTEHLGYEKHAPEGRNTGNSRNGVSPKRLKSDFGKLEIEVPRDRKVTKTRSAFPHDDALRKLLYLAYRDVAKKWTMPLRNWPAIISHLSLFFEGRLVLGLA